MKSNFRGITAGKLTAGILNAPQISRLLDDNEFKKKLSEKHVAAFDSLYELLHNFLGRSKSPRCVEIVESDVSDEQGERFHQDIADMERRYCEKKGS